MDINAVIIGGSLGGISAALALKSIGCSVNVFEKSPNEMKSRGAGIVVQMDLVAFLKKHAIATEESISVPAYKRQYLSKNGDIQLEEQTLQLMTSWDNVYRHLRNALPDNLYHNGKRLSSFKQNNDHVVAEFEDGHNVKCDLLVGSDGPRSSIRQQLLPKVLPKYAGYVAWRGVIDEVKVSDNIRQFFANKFTFFNGKNTHILCYLIPGSNGDLDEGKRRLNWVWYVNIPEGNTLQSLLTDRHEIKRDFSIPQGEVKEEHIKKQKENAQNILPNIFKEIVIATTEPFVQTIFDLSVEQMAFGRVCIMGDAAFVPRPHTAASTSKAATNAMALANFLAHSSKLDIVEALKRWEPSQLALGNYLKDLGICLGNRSQFNKI